MSSIDVKGDGTINRVINDSKLSAYVFLDEYIYYIHSYEADEIADVAEYLAEDNTDVLLYKLMFAGTGTLYRTDKDGSNKQEVQNVSNPIMFTLYTSPNGLYHKSTIWSDNVEKIEFE